MSEKKVWKVVHTTITALEAELNQLHSAGYIVRELKTIGDDWVIVACDAFGVMKLQHEAMTRMSSDMQHTSSGMSSGVPGPGKGA